MLGPRKHRPGVVLGLALVVAGVAVAPASAATAKATGTSRLTLGGPAATTLKQRGVKVSVVRPGKAEARSFLLPVSGGKVDAKGKTATVQHGGALRLKRGKRTLTLTVPTLTVGKQSKLSARIGKRSSSLFTVRIPSGAGKLNGTAQTIVLQNVDVRLTAAGAKTISGKLGLRGRKALRAGGFANLLVDAALRPVGATPPPSTGTPAPPVQQPASVVPVTAAQIVWRQRPSWMQYIQSGAASNPQGGTTVLDGATPGPIESLPTTNGDLISLPYTYSFPFASGWYDPATGTASVSFTGGLRHLYPAHTIDLSVRNPRVVLNGAQSQIEATVSGQAGGLVPAKTGTYVALNAAASPRTVEGNVVTVTNIPGAVPTGAGAGVFQGFYPDGDPYGGIDRLQLTLGQ